MASTFKICVVHGLIPGTQYDWPIDGGIFHTADSTPSSLSQATPIPVPTDGSYRYSYRKNVFVLWTAPPDGSIRNLRFWTGPETVDQGTAMFGKPSQDYLQAGSQDVTTPVADTVDVVTYTETTPLTLTPGLVLSSGQTGRGTQPYMVLQMRLNNTASHGQSAERTMTWTWDET